MTRLAWVAWVTILVIGIGQASLRILHGLRTLGVGVRVMWVLRVLRLVEVEWFLVDSSMLVLRW